ncbi:glycoside-pentoside-hexuronide (GPH):cation symporter [Halalkalibacter flavus]|uniref:glycoside-pentoside-hexuronide (GPH):cation symporter n=1 Tax=Halalkalibacter flavus TaxID=3090668 RepID=UPI002FCBD120
MAKLKLKEKMSYGLGDAANNLTFSMVSTYLLIFYTDVFGITAAAVGTLFLVARIFDAFTDPMMGALIDRYGKNGENGRFRPYLKWAGFPLVILAVLLFTTPDLSDSGKLAYAYVTYILFGMAYTAVNIPYGSLASVMTRDPVERSSLASFRGLGQQVGMFVVGVLIVPMIALFPSQQIGYPVVIAIIGVLALIFYYLAYRNTKERIQPNKSVKPEKMSWKMISRTLKNGPFMALSLMSFFILSAMLLNQAVALYFFTYNLENEMLFPVYNMINIASLFVIIPLIPTFTKRFGKKNVTLCGFLIGFIAFGGLFLLPTTPVIVIFLLWLGMQGIMIPNILVWAFISDVIDYGEWKTGVRQEGTTYSLYSFMRKLSQAIAGWGAAMGLALIGYVPNVAQSPETLFGFKIIMALLPAIACVICFIIFKYGYLLDDEKFKKISADLSA